jgi:gluconokinase
MNLLCLDVSSGGITAALLNSSLDCVRLADKPWDLQTDDGAAVLSVDHVLEVFRQAVGALRLTGSEPLDAICIGTFMHNVVLLDESDRPLTPVFTWLDHRAGSGVLYIREALGDRFHEITGCRFHPMFPVFKLASLVESDDAVLKKARRIVSIKTVLIHRLTGIWVEDHGMASASGLFNVRDGDWDADILGLLNIPGTQLPAVSSRDQIAGRVTASAASLFGLAAGVPVVVGSGDGFLANVGSDCEVPGKIAVTLGTSAVARQTVRRPVFDLDAGTFCYRASVADYLLGCAGSNGGNVLDWGNRILGTPNNDVEPPADLPIFIPLLHGERSPEWNPDLTGSWHGLMARHTTGHLFRSILEGVIFNLAHFVDIVQKASGAKATDLVISGNGFLHTAAAPILAAVTGLSTWTPNEPGMASLRGAGVCALRALSAAVAPALPVMRVASSNDRDLIRRYLEYRRIRAEAGSIGPRP